MKTKCYVYDCVSRVKAKVTADKRLKIVSATYLWHASEDFEITWQLYLLVDGKTSRVQDREPPGQDHTLQNVHDLYLSNTLETVRVRLITLTCQKEFENTLQICLPDGDDVSRIWLSILGQGHCLQMSVICIFLITEICMNEFWNYFWQVCLPGGDNVPCTTLLIQSRGHGHC